MIPELIAGVLLGVFTDGWTARLAGAGLIGAIRCIELVRERRHLWRQIEQSLGEASGPDTDEATRRLMQALLDAELRIARVPPWALYPGQVVVSSGLTLALSLLVSELVALFA